MVRCAIFGCKSDPESKNFQSEQVMFFRFPKDMVLNNAWKNKCYRAYDFNTANARICSKHFDINKDYVRNLKYELLGVPPPKTCRKLTPDAVPALNLPDTSSAVASVLRYRVANGREQGKQRKGYAKLVQNIVGSTSSESKQKIDNPLLKKRKNLNFNIEDKKRLVLLLKKYKDIIENKNTSSLSCKCKNEVWKLIENEFNKRKIGVFRDAKELRLKYESLKNFVRIKILEKRRLSVFETNLKIIMSSSSNIENVHDFKRISLAGNFSLNLDEFLDDADPVTFNYTDERELEQEHFKSPKYTTEWNNKWDAFLKSSKPTSLCHQKKIQVCKKLAEKRLKIGVLEQKLLEKEIEAITREREHQEEIHELELQHLFLKSQLLDTLLNTE